MALGFAPSEIAVTPLPSKGPHFYKGVGSLGRHSFKAQRKHCVSIAETSYNKLIIACIIITILEAPIGHIDSIYTVIVIVCTINILRHAKVQRFRIITVEHCLIHYRSTIFMKMHLNLAEHSTESMFYQRHQENYESHNYFSTCQINWHSYNTDRIILSTRYDL